MPRRSVGSIAFVQFRREFQWRQPCLCLLRILKPGGRNADRPCTVAVETDLLADQSGISSEPAPPQDVTQNYYGSMSGLFVTRDKQTSVLWSNTKHVEEVG